MFPRPWASARARGSTAAGTSCGERCWRAACARRCKRDAPAGVRQRVGRGRAPVRLDSKRRDSSGRLGLLPGPPVSDKSMSVMSFLAAWARCGEVPYAAANVSSALIVSWSRPSSALRSDKSRSLWLVQPARFTRPTIAACALTHNFVKDDLPTSFCGDFPRAIDPHSAIGDRGCVWGERSRSSIGWDAPVPPGARGAQAPAA